jgi:hypothetical protein
MIDGLTHHYEQVYPFSSSNNVQGLRGMIVEGYRAKWYLAFGYKMLKWLKPLTTSTNGIA